MIVTDLWKYYGSELVFQNVKVNVGSTDRIGLVGANGAGKTTLLKVLAGEESADQGSISYGKDYTIGYLTQTLEPTAKTLREYLEEPFREQIDLIKVMRGLEKELEIREEGSLVEELVERYARLQARFEHHGGYDYIVQVRGVATGLGFSEQDLSRDLKTFSGGERMRVSLGRLL
ncbi:MAG: ABC-F family ATP-binding cassette domain-containing protein, partial [Firmicutes bacterium]|nr:ABC-F family ATP-binding cassette domain-containing protein [Bacillota bacterium]